MKIIKQKESELQKSILSYLQLIENKGELYFLRTGSGLIKTEKGHYFKTGKSGAPDISICYKGYAIYFECKTETGKQSEIQKEAEQKIIKAGGYYFIIRSLEEVVNILNSKKWRLKNDTE